MCLPVIGFSSGKYDINANKYEFFKTLSQSGVKILNTVKKINKYMSVKCDKLQFLDICNYLAPNYSYDNFLVAYGATLRKGYFPYEWFDDYSKLKYTELPKKECFHSKLRNTSISTEDYSVCVKIVEGRKNEDFFRLLEMV